MTDELLDATLQAHGGLARWRALETIYADLSLGGVTWGLKGWDGALARSSVTVDPHHQKTVFDAFTASDLTGTFTPERVWISSADGRLVGERSQPRQAFAGHTLETPWDALHLLYFAGYALWTYLTMPFTLTQPDVATRELDPWSENGEQWRRLWFRLPDRLRSHSAEQILYIGPDGLLRRHDYVVEVLGAPPSSHYVDGYRAFDAVAFPTHRWVVPRPPDNHTLAEPLLVTIDIADITLTSTSEPKHPATAIGATA